MRIAIDASRTTVKRVTGTEQYALQLIRALIALNCRQTHPHELILYFRDAPASDLFPNLDHVILRVIPFPRLWTHMRFAAALWQDRPDITFVPAHTLPLFFPGRAIATVHDLGYLYFPAAHPPRQRLYLDWTTRHSARRASVVLADSKATADDLHKHYRTALEKIHVVYPGVDAPPVGDLDAARHKYQLPDRYFLFIGTLQPRKNIARLVQAYARYREKYPSPAGLVLAGAKGWLYDESWTAGVEGIVMPGYIDEADKGTLYAGALALVIPSLYEGFGFPVLEAMHCGTPVITSNTSSLPELTGDAAITCDPRDTERMAWAMGMIASDAALREQLGRRGKIQAAKFTWDAAAKQVMEAIDR